MLHIRCSFILSYQTQILLVRFVHFPLESLFNRSAPYVTLGLSNNKSVLGCEKLWTYSCSRESSTVDDNNPIHTSDAFMNIQPGIKCQRPLQNLLFELVLVNIIPGWLDEKGRRRTAIANNNTFCNEIGAYTSHVIFYGPVGHQSEVNHHMGGCEKTYLVSQREPSAHLIQSSSRPRKT
jgi:hypothetical protein